MGQSEICIFFIEIEIGKSFTILQIGASFSGYILAVEIWRFDFWSALFETQSAEKWPEGLAYTVKKLHILVSNK